MTNVDKQHAAALLERLDAEQATAAVRFMEFLLLDPTARAAATAPADDEPVTEQDRLRIEVGRPGPGGGVTSSMTAVLADFNLAAEDLHAGR